MTKWVADVLIETLQAAGVKRCYGIVGDTPNRIAYAINQSQTELVHMHYEEAGAFAAGAEGTIHRGARGLRGLLRLRQPPLFVNFGLRNATRSLTSSTRVQ
jgi:hypothetical protein